MVTCRFIYRTLCANLEQVDKKCIFNGCDIMYSMRCTECICMCPPLPVWTAYGWLHVCRWVRAAAACCGCWWAHVSAAQTWSILQERDNIHGLSHIYHIWNWIVWERCGCECLLPLLTQFPSSRHQSGDTEITQYSHSSQRWEEQWFSHSVFHIHS